MKIRLALVLLAFAASLSAQTHPTGLTFSVAQSGNDVAFRRLFGSQWAALAIFGYSHATVFSTAAVSGSTDADFWSLGLSGRRYFAPSELRPFAEAGGGMRWTEVAGCPHVRAPFATATGGVEYNIAPRVS